MTVLGPVPEADVLEVREPASEAPPADAPATHNLARGRGRRPPAGNPCGEPTKAGGPCRTPRMTGRTRCRFHEALHDPALAALVKADQARGGALTREASRLREIGLDLGAIDLKDPNDVRRVLAETARAVASGRIPSSVAGSVGQLMGVALRVAEVELSAAVRALEVELARRERDQ